MHRSEMVGIRTVRQATHHIGYGVHAGEMAVHDRRARPRAVHDRWNGELPGQKPTRPRRVDDELRVQREGNRQSTSGQPHAVRLEHRSRQLCLIAVVDAGVLRRAHEMRVDIRAEPVRICHRILGARRHEQSLRPDTFVLERLAGVVAIVRETTLQAAPKLRQVLAPATVRCQPIAVCQPVADAESLQ